MHKISLLFIFVCSTAVGFSQAPTFLFCDSIERGNFNPLNKEIAKINGITKVLESRQYSKKEGSSDSKYLFYTYYYDNTGNLIKTEIHGKDDTIPNAITTYQYDAIGRMIKESQVFNIYRGDKFTEVTNYDYIGDSIIETTCYIPLIHKNIIDTFVSRQYFNKIQLIKFTVHSSLKSDYLQTVIYEYGENGSILKSEKTLNKQSESYKTIYTYKISKKGKKITAEQIGGYNKNAITACEYNVKNQCIKCVKDWPALYLKEKYTFDYNVDGTLALYKCNRKKNIVLVKYSYIK